MNFQTYLQTFQKLGEQISDLLQTSFFDAIIKKQSIENKWFTEENCRFALSAIAKMLDKKSCKLFFQKYQDFFQKEQKLQKIAVISAGNIPCAAFHDFFCILVSGNQFIGRLSSQDALLLPFLSKMLIAILPEFEERIVFVEKLPKFDKIIATGSDNSARYFEFYFKDKPMLLRKNRNSIAVLSGSETDDDLQNLSVDLFQYFGLGCRSVSKLYVPNNFDFSKIIDIFHRSSKPLMHHNSYANNYEYHHAIFSLNQIPFHDGHSFLMVQNGSCNSPIAVLFYEEYKSIGEVTEYILFNKNVIQCVVANDIWVENRIPFGTAQLPSLFDYPDNEDTMLFCVAE